MRNKIILLLMLPVLLIAPLSGVLAQEPTSPRYGQFCDDLRRQQPGEEAVLNASLDEVETQLQTLDTILSDLNAGTLTYLEAINLSEQAIARWAETPRIDCLAAFSGDVTAALDELLIAMLYGQITQNEQSQSHLLKSTDLIAQIRRESATARAYFAQPLQEEVASAPTSEDPTGNLEPVPEEQLEQETGLRSSEELNPLLDQLLRTNSISVLRTASIQVFPGNTVIKLDLDKFVDPAQDYDMDNTLFTLDVLASQIADWQEVPEITIIAVETFANNGTQRTLYVEATGESFRAHYYDQTLGRDAFIQTLNVQIPEVLGTEE
ncbi:MAG TPA: hypothetical protein VJZ27_11590 [Aggregatilineales bacterium]|nr:hypothetical protein [Aggregatilineales bacterium]